MTTEKTTKMIKPTIKEAIVVEGRDDTAAVNRAVTAMTIETHGFGMADSMWSLIEKAYEEQGVIVFTDPDYAGGKIRRKILARFPNCKQAFLPQDRAIKKGDIGIENAAPEDIVEALETAHCTVHAAEYVFTEEDLMAAGLVGNPQARKRREELGVLLGIGYGNGKAMLKKLNQFAIPKEEFFEKVKELG